MRKTVYKEQKYRHGEEGFVLVMALLVMLVLSIIGIAANRNTSIELGIAGNDRTFKETFYEADGGTELAAEVIEQNIACLNFTDYVLSGYDPAFTVTIADIDSGAPVDDTGNVVGNQLGFWGNFLDNDLDMEPRDDNRDFYYPVYAAGEPHTNFRVAGSTKLTTGAAIQMAAGYEGRGKGIGTSGAILVYDINAQHIGKNNSETTLCIQYRHSLGQEGDCFY